MVHVGWDSVSAPDDRERPRMKVRVLGLIAWARDRWAEWWFEWRFFW